MNSQTCKRCYEIVQVSVVLKNENKRISAHEHKCLRNGYNVATKLSGYEVVTRWLQKYIASDSLIATHGYDVTADYDVTTKWLRSGYKIGTMWLRSGYEVATKLLRIGYEMSPQRLFLIVMASCSRLSYFISKSVFHNLLEISCTLQKDPLQIIH